MPAVSRRSKPRAIASVIADASDRLLHASKKKMLHDDGRVDYEKLRREGFSAAMIERLKEL